MANRPGWRQVLKAVFGAFIGVQSEQQRQQDFNSASPLPFILAGLLMALAFVLLIVLTVHWVLS